MVGGFEKQIGDDESLENGGDHPRRVYRMILSLSPGVYLSPEVYQY